MEVQPRGLRYPILHFYFYRVHFVIWTIKIIILYLNGHPVNDQEVK